MEDTKIKEPSPTVRLSAMVEHSIADRLAQMAFHNDRSMAAEVRVALRLYLTEKTA